MKNEVVILINMYGNQFGTSFGGNIYDTKFLCPALMTMQGGGRTPMVVVENEYFSCNR